ncbi:hypothetical protein BJ165DRAFT_1409354 [Panaeolus papilionaceus]|nr:hypothetical protein BJ165DRAFT_1409354 [Panaeolus papilionaceus]
MTTHFDMYLMHALINRLHKQNLRIRGHTQQRLTTPLRHHLILLFGLPSRLTLSDPAQLPSLPYHWRTNLRHPLHPKAGCGVFGHEEYVGQRHPSTFALLPELASIPPIALSVARVLLKDGVSEHRDVQAGSYGCEEACRRLAQSRRHPLTRKLLYLLTLAEDIGIAFPERSSDMNLTRKEGWHPLDKELEGLRKAIDVRGGEKQKLVAAHTFMHFHSNLIIFVAEDEPSSALDAEAKPLLPKPASHFPSNQPETHVSAISDPIRPKHRHIAIVVSSVTCWGGAVADRHGT